MQAENTSSAKDHGKKKYSMKTVPECFKLKTLLGQNNFAFLLLSDGSYNACLNMQMQAGF